jgi:hypothetical protein
MQRTSPNAFAAALLLSLAISLPAIAQDASGSSEASPSEDAEWQAEDTGSPEEEIGSIDETMPDTSQDTANVEEVASKTSSDTAGTEGDSPSDSKKLKRKLKGFLIGLLLPAVERRLRKEADDHDGAPSADDAESGLASVETSETEAEQEP